MTSSPARATQQPVTKNPPKPASTVLAETEAQWRFTETELDSTPSITDGMAPSTERELRNKGLNFILQVGIMLKIQQMTLSTAGVFFNRFLMRHTIQKTPQNPKPLHHYQIAAVALLLATKADETIRRQKDIIIASCRVAQKNPHLQIDEQNNDYWKWRDTLLYNEDVLLEALCFDLTVESPYRCLYDMLRLLGIETHKPLRNAAWAFLCDSLMTTLCLLQTSRTIAGAALYCGARHAGVSLPGDETGHEGGNGNGVNGTIDSDVSKTPSTQANGNTNGDAKAAVKPWYEAVGVRVHDVKKACNFMADLYERAAEERATKASAEAIANGAVDEVGKMPERATSQEQNQKPERSHAQYVAQDPRIYEGLRSEMSDEEEDGEIEEEDEERVEKDNAEENTRMNGVVKNLEPERRGVKRGRDEDEEEGEVT